MKSQPNTRNRNLREFFSSKKIFFKGDLILLGLLIVILAVCLHFVFNTSEGNSVEIYHRGELIGKYSLAEDRELFLSYEGENTVKILDGKVYMADANCPNELCTEFTPISNSSERIICAPNGIVIIITGETNIDAVSGGNYAK